jgi:hypothetical protein
MDIYAKVKYNKLAELSAVDNSASEKTIPEPGSSDIDRS